MPIVDDADQPALGPLCQSWAVPDDVCGPAELDGVLLARWLAVASVNLYNLTGRQWPGECTDTWYPASSGCAPLVRRGVPVKRTDGARLRLPAYPVVSIVEVVVDGVAVDPARYRVEDYRDLVWVPEAGGVRSWPRAEDWHVVYRYGSGPPPGGREAAAALGYQLALSCNPDAGECQLPKRVQSITRQGVTMAILDPLTLFPDGQTGLAEVDSWVAAQRLGAARRPATVYLPGQRPTGHRRTAGASADTVILYGGDAST